MQNNYYFLRHLTNSLRAKIFGFSIRECYSQNKNELVIALTDPATLEEFFIRALLRPDFCCLSFPEKLYRAKKNSVDIFEDCIGEKITGVYQYENERAFLLELENKKSILFKMHGNRSNLIYCRNNKPELLFNNRLQQDLLIDPIALDRPIPQDYETFTENEGNYKKLFPTFGKTVKEYLDEQHYDDKALEEKWQLIQQVLHELENNEYYILENEMPEFSLLNFKKVQSVYSDPLHAVSDFYVRWLSTQKFVRQKTAAIKSLTKEIKKDHSYIQTTRQKLHLIETETNYRQWADLIMAHMHKIKSGEKEVTFDNFYKENEPVIIPLNPELSPQKNAERYYQKAKNQHKEISILKEGIEKRERQKAEKEQKLKEIEATDNYKELSSEVAESKGPLKTKQQAVLPFHRFEIEGYDVLVGKGAKQNDIVLQKYAKKDDLWLHARAASGSHVIVRQKNKEKIPVPVVEKAAQLAAFNSKRKTDTLCPVIVTERKYVRKRKGDPPGAVVVDREQEVIMVEPKMWDQYLV
ncbi:MAG: NFACT RNA binding domain-containing protein [Candidatus Cyclobacteriaceae bacterium M2_1C_046]